MTLFDHLLLALWGAWLAPARPIVLAPDWRFRFGRLTCVGLALEAIAFLWISGGLRPLSMV